MRKTSPPYLIHFLNSQFHPLFLSIHPLTPISLPILPLFSPHSHPTISAYSLLSLLPYSLTAVSHPNVLSLKPRYCSPLSLTPLSLFLPSHLTPISQPYLSLNSLIPFSRSLSYSSHTSLPQPILSLSSHTPLFCPPLLQHSLIPLYHPSHYPTFISLIFLIPLSHTTLFLPPFFHPAVALFY